MSKKIEKNVPYSWFYANLRGFFSLLTCTFVCLIFTFQGSFLAPALKFKGFDGENEKYKGYIMSVTPAFYVISTFVVGYVINKLSKRVFITLSFLSCTLGIIIMGPSYFLGLPNQLWITIIGMAINGAALGFVFIPILPEMIDSVYVTHKMKEGEDEHIDSIICDKAAGLYGSFYSTGMIIAPELGAVIYEHFKESGDETLAFNKTCDVFAMMTLGYTVLYFFCNVLPDMGKEEEQQRAMSIFGGDPVHAIEDIARRISVRHSQHVKHPPRDKLINFSGIPEEEASEDN